MVSVIISNERRLIKNKKMKLHWMKLPQIYSCILNLSWWSEMEDPAQLASLNLLFEESFQETKLNRSIVYYWINSITNILLSTSFIFSLKNHLIPLSIKSPFTQSLLMQSIVCGTKLIWYIRIFHFKMMIAYLI